MKPKQRKAKFRVGQVVADCMILTAEGKEQPEQVLGYEEIRGSVRLYYRVYKFQSFKRFYRALNEAERGERTV